jgi:protein transport protein SEC13
MTQKCSFGKKIHQPVNGLKSRNIPYTLLQVWNPISFSFIRISLVNSISWAPHEYGLSLACASSDGKLSILTYQQEGSWDLVTLPAHSIGVNTVSWMPAVIPGSLFADSSSPSSKTAIKRIASGGCDNAIKLWK